MTRCPPRVKCRGVIPALSHIMLQSDTLANEFNDILNAVEIFAPFQPLDPAITFYAPLRNNVRDLRLSQDNFERASDAWYKDGSGIYRNAGINRPRFEQGRLLMEPARTNKCTNYNANPDAALTGIIEIGDPASVIRRVDDAAELAAAGLSDIAGTFVLEIDNSAGVSVAALQFDGNPNNTNVHTISAWCRKIAGGIGDCDLRYNDNSIIVPFENQVFERIIGTGAPGNSTVKLRLQCQAGAVARVILNQYEESRIVTSPIVTEGTAGQRAVDVLSYENPAQFLNQPEGMFLVTLNPLYDLSEAGDNYSDNIATFNDNIERFVFMRRPAASTFTFRLHDGVTQAVSPSANFSANDEIYVAAYWEGAIMRIGFKRASDTWTWISDRPYAGSFPVTGPMRVRFGLLFPWLLRDIHFYNENRGYEWIEENYP